MRKFVLGGIVVIAAMWLWYAFDPSPAADDTIDDTPTTPVDEGQADDPWAGWKMATDGESGVTFRYPAELGALYLSPMDWPPQLQLVNEPFSCTSAGETTARAGRTEMRVINGAEYCVTQIDEGAAGSIYTQYAYAFPAQEGTAILTFTMRMPQCENYDDPERTACEDERETFTLDPLIDTMARSLIFDR